MAFSKSQLIARRHPRKLPYNIARRIFDEGYFNKNNWKDLLLSQKLSLLNEIYIIMAYEACIPPKTINDSIVYSDSYSNNPGFDVVAKVNLFIDTDDETSFYKSKGIYLGINEFDLNAVSFEGILPTLFHEVIHIMQQQCLCDGNNAFAYSEMQEEWKTDILNMIKNNRFKKNFNSKSPGITQYLLSSTEVYAYMQTEYFRAILISMQM